MSIAEAGLSLLALFTKVEDALAKVRQPEQKRYVVVSTRTDGVKIQGKGGTLTPRVLQRVLDLRNVKPREQRKGKPWRHNEGTNLMKRWQRFNDGRSGPSMEFRDAWKRG